MKTKIFVIGVIIGVIFSVSLALHSQEKRKVTPDTVKPVPKAVIYKSDTILPDSVKANIQSVDSLKKEFQALTDASRQKLKKEEKQTDEMKRNDEKLGELVKSVPAVNPMPTNEIKATPPAYPDSIKIITENKKPGLFKRWKRKP